MFKINGKDGTLIFTDARSLLGKEKEIPLWIIKSFRRTKIEERRIKLNWFFGLGYVLALVSILWVAAKYTVPAWLFGIVYGLSIILIVLKRIDDKKILNVNHGHGKEYIILDTEWGTYLVDCSGDCEKLETFLREYLKKE